MGTFTKSEPQKNSPDFTLESFFSAWTLDVSDTSFYHYNLINNYAFTLRIAASTTCPTRTDVVTLPTPPGTGVIASTIGSTAA